MGWIGDIIQIAMGSDTIWKGVALILLGYFGWQMHKGLQTVLLQLEQTSEALVKNGKPISLVNELTDLEDVVKKDIKQVESILIDTHEAQRSCFMNQQECMKFQQEFRDKPYQMCEKFADCPAVQRKNEHVLRTEALMKENYDKAEKDRAEIKTQIKMVADQVAANRDVLTAFVEHFAREMLVMLKEKEDGRARR